MLREPVEIRETTGEIGTVLALLLGPMRDTPSFQAALEAAIRWHEAGREGTIQHDDADNVQAMWSQMAAGRQGTYIAWCTTRPAYWTSSECYDELERHRKALLEYYRGSQDADNAYVNRALLEDHAADTEAAQERPQNPPPP